jgi:hypothetical protein
MDEMDELMEEQRESIKMAEMRDVINARKSNTKKIKEELEEKERKENEIKDRRLAEGVARRSRLRNHLITVKLLRKEKIEAAIRKEKDEKKKERKRKKEEKARRKIKLKTMDPDSEILDTISDGDNDSENSDSLSVAFDEEHDVKTEIVEETEEFRENLEMNKMFDEENLQRNFEERKRENSLMGKEDVQSFIREISDYRKKEGTENTKLHFQETVTSAVLVIEKAKNEKSHKNTNDENFSRTKEQTEGHRFDNTFKASHNHDNDIGNSSVLSYNNNHSNNNNNNNNNKRIEQNCDNSSLENNRNDNADKIRNFDFGPEISPIFSVRLPLLSSPRNSFSAPSSSTKLKNKSEKKEFNMIPNKSKKLEKLRKKGKCMMTANDEYGGETGESDDDVNLSENMLSRSLDLKYINGNKLRKIKYDDNAIKEIDNSDVMNSYDRRNLFSREMREKKEKDIFLKTMQKFQNASHGGSIDKCTKIINLERFNTLHNSGHKRCKIESEKNQIKNRMKNSDDFSDEIAEKIDLIYQKNKLDLLSTRRVLSLASLTVIKPDSVIEISTKKENLLQIEKQIQKQFALKNSNNRKKELSSNQILLFDNGVQNYFANEVSTIGSADEGMCTVCTVRATHAVRAMTVL